MTAPLSVPCALISLSSEAKLSLVEPICSRSALRSALLSSRITKEVAFAFFVADEEVLADIFNVCAFN